MLSGLACPPGLLERERWLCSDDTGAKYEPEAGDAASSKEGWVGGVNVELKPCRCGESMDGLRSRTNGSSGLGYAITRTYPKDDQAIALERSQNVETP